MRNRVLLACFVLLAASASGQDRVSGIVVERSENARETSVVGARAYWLGTGVGTMSDSSGKFSLPRVPDHTHLIVGLVGYMPDTIIIHSPRNVRVVLVAEARQVGDVNVVGQRGSTYLDYLAPRNTQVTTEKELARAACCNLSESFQSNATVDVSFTDAITGTKQIEMLGLAGVYSQITMENMPYLRGLTSNLGLNYIPGTWIESIQVSKGIGSVANGFESLTGQIDIELRKPLQPDGKKFYLNLYGDWDGRFEANLNARSALSDAWSSMTLLHGSLRNHQVDGNSDGFLDMPTFQTLNLLQRFMFHGAGGMDGQVNVQVIRETKNGGSLSQDHGGTGMAAAFPYETDLTQVRLHGKTGYVFPGSDYRSAGIQWSISKVQNSSKVGPRKYDGEEYTGYLNALYQTQLIPDAVEFRTGISFLFDQFVESLDQMHIDRIERIPGAFAELTYKSGDEFTAVAGLRADQHNYFGTMITPRLHLRYTPQQDWVFRLAAGRGYRSANIFAENAALLASSRTVVIIGTEAFGSGLKQESAWNYGLNITRYFLFDYREGAISVDFYRTQFDRQTVADLDFSPQQVRFLSISDGSYSNSAQVELNFQPLERWDVRVAYRYLDVQQNVNGVWLKRPFTSAQRSLFSTSYATEREDPSDPQMTYDLTIQWHGPKRIPSTATNPAGLQMANESPSFFLLSGQITRSFFAGMDVYLGMENMFDFRQENPILDWHNPGSQYFDASIIWGPVTGRMIYLGVRYQL